MKIKYIHILFIFILSCSSNSSSWKAEIGIRKNYVSPPILEISKKFSINSPIIIAVLPAIRNETQIEPRYDVIMENSEKIFIDILESEFLRLKNSKFVSRTKIKNIIKEISFQKVNLRKESIKKMGKLLAADAILFTRIDKCIVRHVPQGVYNSTYPLSEVSFFLQLLDVKTGEILFSCNHTSDSTRLLSSTQVFFEVDTINSTIVENKSNDKKSLEDYRKLIHIMIKEIVDNIKERIN